MKNSRKMEREKFEKLVEEAMAQLPRKFKKLIQNLAVFVEDAPSREVYNQTGVSGYNMILGTYHGVPYKHRGPYYGNIPPDTIVIYQKPIESICFTDEEIRNKVKEVVLHEVGHYFGMTDKQLRDIEKR